MSVLFETSLGDIIVDLETSVCPTSSLNFLKLCKTYYYNFNSFHNVIPNFIAQSGDPTDTGSGGASVFSLLPKSSPAYSPTKYFVPEVHPSLKHTALGTLSMAVAGEGDARGAGSQFFLTLAADLDYLDGKHAPFGKIVEGEDVLAKINEALCDQKGRPLRDIRIRHVIVLDDPFDDPVGLDVPPASPVPTTSQLTSLRVGDEEALEETGTEEEIEEARRAREARAQALTLEMVGDLPFADVAPPENVLFVCKLNQVTKSEDLELIFSRFGEIWSCEVICDQKTGDSLQYAFVEFKEREAAERAYIKMDNVLVDDRRIHVDFSQSVSKLHNAHVFKKTGGRPPLNKGPAQSSRHRGQSPPSGSRSRYGGGGSGRSDLVFDMGEVHQRESNRPRDNRRGDGRGGASGGYGSRDGYGGGSRGGDRGHDRDRGYDRRDERERGEYSSSSGGGGSGGRRDDHDRRGGGGGGGGGMGRQSYRPRSRSPPRRGDR